MDTTALYRLSYGVFMLASRSGETVNGCITNTCIQLANDPVRIAVCVINSNYTCDIIKKSGVFCLSLLDRTCSFDTIVRWGFQTGRKVDKFAGMELPEDENGVPYLTWSTCLRLLPEQRQAQAEGAGGAEGPQGLEMQHLRSCLRGRGAPQRLRVPPLRTRPRRLRTGILAQDLSQENG